MLDAEEIIGTINHAYEARIRGDKEQLKNYWTADAEFRIPGATPMLGDQKAGPAHPNEAVSHLVDQFTFSDPEQLAMIVDGNKAAVHWRLKVAVAGKEPVTTEILDLFTFGEDGKMTSLTQFVDTALLRDLVS